MGSSRFEQHLLGSSIAAAIPYSYSLAAARIPVECSAERMLIGAVCPVKIEEQFTGSRRSASRDSAIWLAPDELNNGVEEGPNVCMLCAG
jgi:hypothetical protein